MDTLHEAIRAQFDNYAASDPSDGDYGDFQREHAAPELFAAVRDILDYVGGLGAPFVDTIYGYVATALGVSTEPAQPTRQWAVEHPSWETVAHHSITSALYTLDHPPLGDRARLVTRMSDQTEWVPCGRDGEPLPAQAEPRVWQPMDTAPRDGTTILGRYDGVQVVDIRWSEERVCMLASVAPGAGMFGPGWEDVANGLYIDNPEAWMPLSEVTDQAGEA